ncbi:unnamed protein product [Rotaria sordida]|uniref:Peptidase S1 domain-containing protein n=1 Tax=Rotaria sordida TaxID=392033 RepID=A0A818PBC7_9BILA|nr:unnamed protein product [Rotaria sordida]
MILFCMLIFLCIVQSSAQAVYTCNSNASCGCSTNSTTVNRIINGETAEATAWSWTVSLLIEFSYFCGGSILSDSWIITAAHCMEKVKPSDVIVYAGSNIRFTGSQSRKPSRIVVHPNYDSSAYTNDIALIELSFPLNMMDSSIHTLCLPSVHSSILANGEWPVPNTTVIAVGWGRMAGNGSSSMTLQQVTLQIIAYQVFTCSSVINDRRLQLCAGVSDGSKDTCQGDSGGPLMMLSSKNQWILAYVKIFGLSHDY